jgi:hypothetical protein
MTIQLATLPTVQAPSDVVMVRPSRFRPNPSTADDNTFQSTDASRSSHELAAAAYGEVTALADALTMAGVTVHLFDYAGDDLPDSVFPNNWFSTHPDGRVALYPMSSPSRRGERRHDVVDLLRDRYRVADVTDYSGMEADQVFLEGTGAMVLDHIDRTAFIARSDRAHDRAVSHVCADLDYQPVIFTTTDRQGVPIYHTNVMMCVATTFALVGLETITDRVERHDVENRLLHSGRDVIALTHDQIGNFAGNAIELRGTDGAVLALSQRAYDSLTPGQRASIELHCTLLPVAVPTIELAGGSVRCMIAGIHLDAR